VYFAECSASDIKQITGIQTSAFCKMHIAIYSDALLSE